MTVDITSGNSEEITLAGEQAINVRNDADSTGTVTVHIAGLHTAGVDDDTLGPGESGLYRAQFNRSATMTLTAVGGNVTVRWGAAINGKVGLS